jgi:hypothetical protein
MTYELWLQIGDCQSTLDLCPHSHSAYANANANIAHIININNKISIGGTSRTLLLATLHSLPSHNIIFILHRYSQFASLQGRAEGVHQSPLAPLSSLDLDLESKPKEKEPPLSGQDREGTFRRKQKTKGSNEGK